MSRCLVVLRGTLSPAKERRKRSKWVRTSLWLKGHTITKREQYRETKIPAGAASGDENPPSVRGGGSMEALLLPYFWTRITAPAVDAVAAAGSRQKPRFMAGLLESSRWDSTSFLALNETAGGLGQ